MKYLLDEDELKALQGGSTQADIEALEKEVEKHIKFIASLMTPIRATVLGGYQAADPLSPERQRVVLEYYMDNLNESMQIRVKQLIGRGGR